jgi:hypothetical protein
MLPTEIPSAVSTPAFRPLASEFFKVTEKSAPGLIKAIKKIPSAGNTIDILFYRAHLSFPAVYVNDEKPVFARGYAGSLFMNKYILYLLVAIIPSVSLADDKTMKILDKAYIHALDKQYKQAIDKTLPLLDSLALSNTDEIILAHQILSLSFCETGNKEKAAEHLKALRAFSPSEDFRVFNPSAECQKMLDSPPPSNKKKK